MSKEETDDRITAEDAGGDIRPSISIRLVRHAESNNNEVYRNARYIFRGGTPDFDLDGWSHYVETHRRADPSLSPKGFEQADHLGKFLAPHLDNQASHPVRIITSPMRRTLETIRPTLEQLKNNHCQMIVNAFYHESEGCHSKNKPEEGMNPNEIRELFKHCIDPSNMEFVGFPEPDRGWYVNGTGEESRAEAEMRAAKFYLWLSEYLDQQLLEPDEDVFDASVQLPEEENECEHDKTSPRHRRRRTAILVGHGDFMSLVLKRMVTGYGHYVEAEGVPHRSCFVHFNTGMTEIEYFGHGRYMVMNTNQTPHFAREEYSKMRTGGSLKDGWSYLVPPNQSFVQNQEVSVAFADELQEHVREQTEALKSLYLSSDFLQTSEAGSEDNLETEQLEENSKRETVFCVQQGLQVVGVATYLEDTGHLKDVAVRPSADKHVAEKLLNAVRDHSRKLGRSGSIIVHPRSSTDKDFFESMGYEEKDHSGEHIEMEFKHS